MESPIGTLGETPIVCKNCQIQLDTLERFGIIAKNDIAALRMPRRILEVNFPISRDSAKTEIVQGFRVQYNDDLGPTKGGIRIHQDANIEEVTGLAFLMTLKTSLVGLPYGGAKGAIKINPKEYSKEELERVVRGYIRQIARFIGPNVDIPAPDVNTDSETIAVMLDEYENIVGHRERAAFTGKPFFLGGSLGRETATSVGGYCIIRERMKNFDPQNIKVAIQGFGNVGGNLAEILHEEGYRIVALSDSTAALYEEEGLDVRELSRFKKDGRNFRDHDTYAKITNEELLILPLDLLIPAALGGVVSKEKVEMMQARVIIEMANAPIDPEADSLLTMKGVEVIPDILANSGGVIVSYYEWVQNNLDEQWTKAKVEKKLKDTILAAYKKVLEESRRSGADLRRSSYTIAIKRILEATKIKSGKE